jgi:PAS domain S-box-containing protein
VEYCRPAVTEPSRITEWRPAERRLAAQYAVTRALAEASGLEDATPRLLSGVCDSLGWEVGALWRVDRAAQVLRCVATWRQNGVTGEFDRLSRATTFAPGIGLPGRIWASAKATWIPDVVSDGNFPRAPVAAKEGLHAAFGFPILLHGEVLGVVEFFSRTILPPDDELLATTEVIGSQIGQFIERTGAEAAVRESEARHAAILQSALDAVITMDHEGKILEFNPAAERVFGYRRADVIGREMCEFIIPASLRDRHRKGMARYLESGEGPVLGRRIEITGMRADQSEFPVELAITRVDLPGQPVFTGYIRDITERKRAEAAIQEGKAQLDAVIQTIGDALLVFDPAGRLLLANPAAEALLGRRVGTLAELLAALETATAASSLPSLLAEGGTTEVRVRGDRRWVEVNAYGVGQDDRAARNGLAADHQSGPSRIFVLREITAAKEEQAARDAFLGILSHELRTPLTTIYAGTEVLGRKDGRLPEDLRRELYGDIKEEARRLQLLVEDLLVLARIERGSMDIGKEPVLLQRIIPRVVESERRRWPGTRFELTIPPGLPTAQADTTYVEQLARNLIGNAAKYSPPGATVSVVVQDAGERIELRVLDDGPGFQEDEGPRLFELFYRSPSTAGKASGAGIGLFVARQLVESMGGTIWACRRPEGGSEFGFALQLVPAEPD